MQGEKQNPTVISLYCGAGGMDYGFKQAGYEILLGIEINKAYSDTYEKFSNTKFLNKDLIDIDYSDIPYADVIIGKFPVPPFTTRLNEVQDFSGINSVLKLLKIKKPRAFVLESFKGLVNFKKGSFFQEILKVFSESNYQITHEVMNTKDFGIAQNKEKLIIVGIRNDIEKEYTFPGRKMENVLVKDVVCDYRFDDKDYKSSLVNPPLQGQKNRYKKVILESISPPLLGTLRYIIGNEKVGFSPLTLEEAAAIQSFPKDFEFVGSRHSKMVQIVTSFPPKLSFELAKSLLTIFDLEEKINVSGKCGEKPTSNLTEKVKKELGNQPKQEDVDNNLSVQPELKSISMILPGKEQAHDYHNTVFEYLKIIFEKELRRGKKETPINSGRKRIDITFDNAGKEGFFFDLKNQYDIKCAKILIECKNYNESLQNPEFDQLTGRFNNWYGEFGLLICRSVTCRKKSISQCKDILNSGKGVVIVLTDEDLKNLMALRNNLDFQGISDYMRDLLNEVIT